MKTWLKIAIFLLWLGPAASAQQAPAATSVAGSIEQVGDTVHLEFKGASYWDYKLTPLDKGRVQVTLPSLDATTKVKLQTWKSAKVKKIEVQASEKAGSDLVTLTLDDNTETFDYLTDDPSRLIVDLYPKATESTAKVAPAAVAPKKEAFKKLPPKKTVAGVEKVTRKPASDELIKVEDPTGPEDAATANLNLEKGMFDAGDADYKRFAIKDYEIKEEAIIASKQNIYLPFPILKLPTSLLEEFRANQPDYKIIAKETAENKEAQLLLTLFKEKRHAMFLKTYEFFISKYKESGYDEIVRHLAAEVFYQQWLKSHNQKDYLAAKDLYTYLVEKYPKSVLHDRTNLLIAFNELERKNGMETVQRFQEFLKKNPESEYRDWAKKALAEGYIILGKYDDALATYADLQKQFVDKKSSIEAAFRVGDVFFARKDFAGAVKAYKDVIQKYPDYQGVFPNAYYNMAESMFWLGDYRNSLDNFLSYVRLFPDHPFGGYALTRVGELLDILGADKGRSMGAFLESTFRFQNSEGAKVARVRMLSQRMKSMKDKELKQALDEMAKVAKQTNLPKIEEFVTLMESEGYRRRNSYDKAIDQLVQFYQKNPTTLNLEFFSRRIRQNIADLIQQKVEKEEFIDAMDLASKYKPTWLKNSERMDIPYMLGEAYEQAGVFNEAESIYRATLAQMNKMKGTAEEKERRVNEYLPKFSEVELRLAKALWQQKQFSRAFDELQKTSGEELSQREQIERVELAADLHEQRGDRKKALASLELLEKSWKGQKDLIWPVYLRLGRLQNVEGKYDVASEYIQNIVEEKLPENPSTKMEDLYVQALQLKADNLLALNQPLAAVDTYMSLLTDYEKKYPLENARYKAGRILYGQGDLKGAEKIWSALDGKKGAMYKRMAAEKLEDVKWQGEYRKYIERIPAATGLKGAP